MKTDKDCNISVTVYFFKEGKFIVAYCPSLEISGYGNSLEEAEKSFDIEMEIFKDETIKKGYLNDYLLNLGWQLRKIPKFNYQPPKTNKVISPIKQEQRFLAIC